MLKPVVKAFAKCRAASLFVTLVASDKNRVYKHLPLNVGNYMHCWCLDVLKRYTVHLFSLHIVYRSWKVMECKVHIFCAVKLWNQAKAMENHGKLSKCLHIFDPCTCFWPVRFIFSLLYKLTDALLQD